MLSMRDAAFKESNIGLWDSYVMLPVSGAATGGAKRSDALPTASGRTPVIRPDSMSFFF